MFLAYLFGVIVNMVVYKSLQIEDRPFHHYHICLRDFVPWRLPGRSFALNLFVWIAGLL